MRNLLVGSTLLFALAVSGRAQEYALDDAHTSTLFMINHLGISWTYGRFNEVTGTFTVSKDDPAKSAFALTIKTDSVDTGNKKRDDHLRSPDFFNAKQFPVIAFKSTEVKEAKEGLDVKGDLTMHGVTKPVAFTLKGGKTAEFPKGVSRIGYAMQLILKRTDFGMDKLVGPVGDEVHVSISFEGIKK